MTTQIVAHQAPLSIEFSRQDYWNGLPFLLLDELPNPGIEPVSSVSPELAGRFFTSSATREAATILFLGDLPRFSI